MANQSGKIIKKEQRDGHTKDIIKKYWKQEKNKR